MKDNAARLFKNVALVIGVILFILFFVAYVVYVVILLQQDWLNIVPVIVGVVAGGLVGHLLAKRKQ